MGVSSSKDRADGPVSQKISKILVCITEDWFALSHFKPLLRALVEISDEVVVACRSSGRMAEIEALGCRPVEFDYKRSALNPLLQLDVVRRLTSLMQAERPDVVHYIALQTLAVGSMASRLAADVPHHVMHLTGLGFLGVSSTLKARAVRTAALRLIGAATSRPGNWLLAENPDDVAMVRAHGGRFGERFTILGGAGIDGEEFPARAGTGNEVPVAGFVGRLIRSKGVHILASAVARARERGAKLSLALYGKVDEGNPDGVTREEIDGWISMGGVKWHGHVTNVSEVWTKADIAVLPTLGGEGLPRSALEAACSARPLIVSDVPGCRHLVRHDVEGLVVPPGDAEALADALVRLAADPALRSRLGAAARERVLSGFTTAHLRSDIRDAYAKLIVH